MSGFDGTLTEYSHHSLGTKNVFRNEKFVRLGSCRNEMQPSCQPWYSPLAILMALTLRTKFRLALRRSVARHARRQSPPR
jgi:hypothetical protein